MARSRQVAAVREFCTDVSVVDFIAASRPVSHLFDLAPHLAPAAFGSAGGYAAGAPVFGTVRTQGERQADVRLLVDDGERHLGLATALAESLRCDVYLAPEGARVRCVRESSPMAGDCWEAIAVDRATGEPTTWLVVRPADLPADVPTWFSTVRGRLRPSHGIVTVTLPDGLAFATKSTFRDTIFMSTTMRRSPGRVTTLAVTCERGKFEISRFDDAGSLLGGVEFATLVAASLDVIHPDIQLALTWPADTVTSVALDAELTRFADELNRTVWVPRPQGAAHVLPGCGEFAAVDEVGSPSGWQAYGSPLAMRRPPRQRTDPDGRLVPPGAAAVTAFVGVPLVSVPAPQLERLRPWYESVAPCQGLFAIDLAVLADGRLGVILRDGTPLAVGPRGLRELLRDAGWSGGDLLVLTQPPAEYWEAAVEHLRHLADQLMVDVWFPALGADVWAERDGTLAAAAADGTDRAWCVVTFGKPIGDDAGTVEQVVVPAALATAPRPPARPRAEAGVPAAADVAGGSSHGEVQPPAVEAVAVTLPVALGAGRPHGIDWLTATPVVNSRAVELYLWTPQPDDHVEAWGMPSADLFLIAGQDPLRLAERRRDGYLLRVSAPEATAVDLHEHLAHAPPAIRQRLLEAGSTHLLPLAWLADLRVTARFDLDGRSGIAARSDVNGGALAIRFEGAGHGVPGLPNDVVRWPDKGQRAGIPSYLMLRDDTALDRVSHRGFVPLSRRKPSLAEGHSLMELKVRKRRAIDVPTTLGNLSGLPIVGRLHDFVGLDLLLPEADLSQAVVSKIWRFGPMGKPVVDRPVGQTLATTLAIPAAAS